ncbi:MAG TPA: glutathione binding-like protein, partial [Chloroflexota bacterium]|nr:glutathione binding-like protein [Chloroflexota bacterium]
ERSFAALERTLEGRDYLTGGSFTLADLAVASAFNFAAMCGVTPEGYPKTAAWVKRCLDRPARAKAR